MAETQNRRGNAGPESSSSNDSTGLNLPAEFWNRPVLQHIRQAAHAQGCSADVVLCATLARLSALVSHELRFDAGLGQGSLNLFVAAVGPSGVGKSTSTDAARSLLGVPQYLQDPDSFRDGISIGTGEGLAELYMGLRNVETTKPNGQTKTEKVRAQVRNNAFVAIDEGQTLLKLLERSGATVGPTLRSAWVGATIGSANATADNTRYIPQRSYALGLVMGLQEATAQPLLADAATGTPQRFLWCSATNPDFPPEPPTHPGRLAVQLSDDRWIAGSAIEGTIEFADEIRVALWRHRVTKNRGEHVDPELDAHWPLMRCKVAALLAVLDRRLKVDADDWNLSGTVWDTSRAVRDNLIAWGETQRRVEAESRHAYAATREQRLMESREDFEDKRLERITRYMAKYMSQAPEGAGCSEAVLKRALASRDRKWFKNALELAKERKWIATRFVKLGGYGDLTTTEFIPGPNVGGAT